MISGGLHLIRLDKELVSTDGQNLSCGQEQFDLEKKQTCETPRGYVPDLS